MGRKLGTGSHNGMRAVCAGPRFGAQYVVHATRGHALSGTKSISRFFSGPSKPGELPEAASAAASPITPAPVRATVPETLDRVRCLRLKDHGSVTRGASGGTVRDYGIRDASYLARVSWLAAWAASCGESSALARVQK